MSNLDRFRILLVEDFDDARELYSTCLRSSGYDVIEACTGTEAVALCSTAQHRELVDDALAAFELAPDRDLDLMRPGQKLGALMGRMAQALEPVIEELRPRTVIVQGDTLTVMVASLVAFLCGARVAHVEAGLRTRDKRAPFPEEVSRRVAEIGRAHV